MKNCILVLLTFFLFSNGLQAINPENSFTPSERLILGSQQIDTELEALSLLEKAIIEQNHSYTSLQETHGDLTNTINLSPVAQPGIFSGHPDTPLGIPGFWWGFCIGFWGILIIYLSMDEGEARKEQIMNALYGALSIVVLSGCITLLYFIGIFALTGG